MHDPAAWLVVLEQTSYVGIFVLLSLGGYAVPLPEEVLLLLVGYMAATGFINLWVALAVSIAGVLTGDFVLFALARHHSHYIEKFQHRLSPRLFQRYRGLLEVHPGKTIFVLRFIVGLRFLGPVVSGSVGISQRVYQTYDALAVAVYVPLFIFLGFHFQADLTSLLTRVVLVRHFVTLAVVGLVGIVISLWVHRWVRASWESRLPDR
jgi:membrane protein DedA with SNARE-associated domain